MVLDSVGMSIPPAIHAKQRILELSRRHVCPHRVDVWEASGAPLVIDERASYRLRDLAGHELIDVHLNGGTYNLGHRNPDLLDALVTAVERFDIGNHHFPSIARAELAERLAQVAPGDLPYVVYSASGGEAIDVAIKTARRATSRRKVVGLDGGYHGRIGLAGACGDDAGARYFLSDLPDEFEKVPFGDLEAMAARLAHDDVAAVVIETVPATLGFPIPPAGYLPGVKRLCAEHGALYVADEVQTGLGRTGSLWGVQAFGVEPDLLVTGKGLSGGIYPFAATLISDRAGGWLKEHGWAHVSTFGGSEIGCRVAARVLDLTTRDAVQSNVEHLIERFQADLTAIQEREPFLLDVRQCGLVIGLRVDHSNGAVFLQQELYERGLWAIASGFDLSVLQLKPGLLLDDALTDTVLELVEEGLRRAKDVDRQVVARHPARTGSER